jgi:hypothetical protein
MLRPPADGTRLELSSFVRPGYVPGSPAAMANELGRRSVAFEVADLRAAVGWAAGRLGAGRDHRRAGRARRLNRTTPASSRNPRSADHQPGQCGGLAANPSHVKSFATQPSSAPLGARTLVGWRVVKQLVSAVTQIINGGRE